MRSRCWFYFYILMILVPIACSPDSANLKSVENYNIEISVEPSNNERKVVRMINTLCENEGVETLSWDGALSMAARSVAMRFADAGLRSPSSLDTELIMVSVNEAGGTDEGIRTQVASLFRTKDAQKVVDGTLKSELISNRFTHMGVAIESRLLPPIKYLVVMLSRRSVLLEPFPKKVKAGQSHILSGTIYLDVENPKIHVVSPAGEIINFAPTVKAGGTFDQEIAFNEGGGTYSIELAVEGKRGPEIAALFNVRCLGEPKKNSRPTVRIDIPDLPPAKTQFEAEERLFSYVNQERMEAGKVQLVRDGKLDRVARNYAGELANQGTIEHVTMHGEDVADRVVEAGIKFRYVAENLAVNQTVIKAHQSLMSSPAHAVFVMDNRFTLVGIGAALVENDEGRSVYVVEIFMLPF